MPGPLSSNGININKKMSGWGAGMAPKGILFKDLAGLVKQDDRDKLAEYAELYRELGAYPYDQDPARPGWAALIPNDRWADPDDDRPVDLAWP